MDSLRGYLTAIVAVCMIAVLANVLVRHSGIRRVVRLISGLLIVLTVLGPLVSVDMDVLSGQLSDLVGLDLDMQDVQSEYQHQLRENIRQTTERYIEEKANELGACVQAEVELSDEEYPTPIAVKIIGSLNQTQLTALTRYLTDNLGIAPENQEWKLYGTNQ